MKKQLQLGLVVEGNSTGSAILRLPKIAEELGPIKSATLRVARRLSNSLRAGYAVSDYEGLQAARLILLRAPDRAVTRIVEELCASELKFANLSFVLSESWLMNDVLEPLRARGASVATLLAIRARGRRWFVVEGQVTAVRHIRHLMARNEARALELRPGTKQLYFAAELLTRAIPVPLFMGARQALRASGISGRHLQTLLDEMAHEMLKDSLEGARTSWGGPLTECSVETANGYFERLRRNHPRLAEIVDEQLLWARRRMSKHATASG